MGIEGRNSWVSTRNKYYIHTTMKKGKLKFNNRFKGYGLIADFETGIEYKVSPAGIKDNAIKDGDKVSFEATEGRGGLIAIDIRRDTFLLNS